jgi:tetratricopeptide (TPR) repeat protein
MRLEEFMRRLHKLDGDLTFADFADMLWLAKFLPSPASSTTPTDNALEEDDNENALATFEEFPLRFFPESQSGDPTQVPDFSDFVGEQPLQTQTEQQPELAEFDLSTPEAQLGIGLNGTDSNTQSTPVLPFRTPGVTAVSGGLRLARALRPLMRQIPSNYDKVLDEETTIYRIAEEGVWLPVLKPASERWLELTLLVDKSRSMVIWERTIQEIAKLMESFGIFKNVQRWQIWTDKKGELTLTKNNEGVHRARDIRELQDASGRRLIIVMSDCVAACWRDGTVFQWLAQLAKTSPLGLFQLLPNRMWDGTALAKTDLGRNEAVQFFFEPGEVSNRRLIALDEVYFDRVDWRNQNRLALPVIELEPTKLEGWARTIAQQGESQTSGYLIDLDVKVENPPKAPSPAQDVETLPPTNEANELLERFLATASQSARVLAVWLSPFEFLNLPLIRLIQRKVLTQTDQSHLAEVYLSGLLAQLTPNTIAINERAERIQFSFVKGVRELLYAELPPSAETEIWATLTNFVDREASPEQLVEFSSFLIVDDSNIRFDGTLQQFAAVTAQKLINLGGKFAEVGNRLKNPINKKEKPEFRRDLRRRMNQLYYSKTNSLQTKIAALQNVSSVSSRHEPNFLTSTTNRFYELPDEQKRDVINLFLSLPAFRSPSDIQSVVMQLPPALQQNIPSVTASESLLEAAANLVRTCADYSDGFETLVRAVAYINGEDSEYKKLGNELLRLKLIESVPEPNPISLSERLTSGLPNPNPNFVGRETQLAEIQKTLAASKRAALCALQGMGGVGKTTLALEYAHLHMGEYRLIAWLDATDTTTLDTSFNNLAHALGLREATQADYNIVRRAVLNYLTRESQWLLIYDNAEDPATLRDYLPDGTSGHVLITTRNTHWQTLAQPILLDTWHTSEALEFLLRYAGQTDWGNETEERHARQLVEELGGLPLALMQAAAFMATMQVGVAKYRELFNKHKLELFKDKPLDYHTPVATTWNISIDALMKEQPKALLLLNLCAFFAPEPTRFELLQEARERMGEKLKDLFDPNDDYKLTKVRAALRRYALAIIDETSLTLHRLVGLVIRENLAKKETEYNVYATCAADVMNELYPHNSDDYQNWERCEELLRHAETIAGYADAANVALDTATRLYNETGLYLQGRAHYTAARHNFERALAIAERDLGAEQPIVAVSYNNMGSLLRDLGDLPAAKSYLERAIAINERVYGNDNLEIAQSYNNLGLLLQEMGDLPTAKVYYERAIIIREKILGREHPSVATSYNNLGSLLWNLGEYNAAKSYLERAIAISEHVLGKEHPDTATRYNNLGLLLGDMGEHNAAKSYLERAIAISEKTLGEVHPSVATSYNNLGNVLRNLGELPTAKNYLERATAIDERVYGTTHPEVAASYNNLAAVLQDMGDLPTAKVYYERAIAIREQVYGLDHPDTAQSYKNLGVLLWHMGDSMAARDYLTRALSIFRAKLGEQHPYTQNTLAELQWIETKYSFP